MLCVKGLWRQGIRSINCYSGWIINNFEGGDSYMVDKGFNIKDLLLEKSVK